MNNVKLNGVRPHATPHGCGGAERGYAMRSEGVWLTPAKLVPRKRQAARPANEVCERGV